MIAAQVKVDIVAEHCFDRVDQGFVTLAVRGVMFVHAGITGLDGARIQRLFPRRGERHRGKGDRVEIARLIGGGRVKAVERAIRRADLQELVGVGVIDPVGGLIIPELARKALRHHLPVATIGEHGFGIGHLSHAQGLAQTRQDFVGMIVAVIGKDQELIHTQCRVMRDPFQNVGTFVPHCRNDHHGFAVHHRGVFRSKGKVRVAQSYR